ncbi:hypothetical protein BZG01_00380 [Labilibaculum manganireducens]|uniref:Uncharacterized protein n=1 Tax=Labilibaculum manganireducens TaxID=1940525 RepID=A0A2N3IGH8_9BACT|nr:hypothetical protein BZG01_00380 [Labilibaculum manganireducens]
MLNSDLQLILLLKNTFKQYCFSFHFLEQKLIFNNQKIYIRILFFKRIRFYILLNKTSGKHMFL